MKFHTAWMLSLAILISACGTPRERCEASASEELLRVESLISQVELDLSRGYRVEQELRPGFELRFCHDVNNSLRWCNHHVTRVSDKEVAIDPLAEQRKLDGLNARRDVLVQEYGAALARCTAEFPAKD